MSVPVSHACSPTPMHGLCIAAMTHGMFAA